MEKDFSRGQFEELLTERTGEYKMYPTEKVWSSIYHRLHTRRKWHFIGWGTFALMTMAGVFVLMQDNPRPPSKIITARKSSPVTTPGATTSRIATINNRTAPQHSLSFTRNAYLNQGAGTYLLQSPAWIPTAPQGIAEVPAVSKTLAADVPVAGSGTQGALHMTENVPLAVSAASVAKGPAVPSNLLKIIKAPTRYSWLFHFEPSVSFRMLKSKAAITTTNLGFIVVDNNGYDINHLVEQKPSVGFEVGTDLLYSLTDKLRLKAGLQFNYSRYSAAAMTTAPQRAVITLGGPGTGGIPQQSFSSTTSYVNGVGQPSASATWIPDQRIELSIPLGAEYQVVRTRSFSWNVAGTFQPTYILNAKAFLLSSDYKSYVQYPNLLRTWNMNVGAETFLRFDRGDIQIQVGPQFRYQLLPSFISSYPISEHLYDIGFKIGITRTIR
jgi:hypothetical protein